MANQNSRASDAALGAGLPERPAPEGMRVPLGADEAHVWLVAPADGQTDGTARDALRTLDEDERRRAAAFRFARDRDRFIAAHRAKRAILAVYAGIDPTELRFSADGYGKPCLCASPADTAPVQFNISHAAGWTLVGVSRAAPIGVDIEAERAIDDMDGIAAANFAAGEVRQLRTLAPDRRRAGFFACWTRKEAFVKAQGIGLTGGLGHFEVSVDPTDARLLAVDGSEPAAFGLWGWQPAPGVHAAVAVCGRLPRLRQLRYAPD
ncbi:MAG TPA: 4'-phosphopantetheinyl transferase superfamily protein [Xanthobacteraceae bacterium]|nr:4'-phosphopantetheinyl transferase superfamily protein [Xanthobacteraceae bacterium]